MNIRFYIDQKTGEPHIYNHNVTEHEVQEVMIASGDDRQGKDGSRIAIGQTFTGRYLKVIYVPDSQPKSIFVITAYELKGKPLAAYRRRKRRRILL